MNPDPVLVAETYRSMQQIKLRKEQKINIILKPRDNKGTAPGQDLPGDPYNPHLGKEIDGHV